jgi:hypothetical protein
VVPIATARSGLKWFSSTRSNMATRVLLDIRAAPDDRRLVQRDRTDAVIAYGRPVRAAEDGRDADMERHRSSRWCP